MLKRVTRRKQFYHHFKRSRTLYKFVFEYSRKVQHYINYKNALTMADGKICKITYRLTEITNRSHGVRHLWFHFPPVPKKTFVSNFFIQLRQTKGVVPDILHSHVCITVGPRQKP